MNHALGATWIVIGTAACGPHAPVVAPSPPSTISWTTRVRMLGAANLSFWTVDSVVATRGDHPTLAIRGARFATGSGTATADITPPQVTASEIIGVTHAADASTVQTLGGEHYDISIRDVPATARWLDLSPGVLAMTVAGPGVVFTHFHDSTPDPDWTQRVDDSAATAVERVGWFANGDPLLAVWHVTDATVGRLRLDTHAFEPLAHVPLGLIAFSERTQQLAVVHEAPTPACTTCDAVSIVDLATGSLREFALPRPGERTATGNRNMSVGLSGTQLWMYEYTPESRNDFRGLKGSEGCGYDVYDIRTGTRTRTLAAARGDWARLTSECHVRALLPMADGGALAFVVVGERVADVVKLTAPP